MSGLYFTVDWATLGLWYCTSLERELLIWSRFAEIENNWSVSQQTSRTLMSLQLKWCERVVAGLNLRACSTFAQ
jgi:hypothetical protein